MKIINLTPHEVTIVRESGDPIRIPASGQVARVSVRLGSVGAHGDIPLVRGTYGEVTGLPPTEEGVLLVVSALVRAACPRRTDLASPADLVRDAEGRIIGCRSLEVS